MPQSHIIGKQILSVDITGTESDGIMLQHALSAIAHGPLVNTLEQLFDECVAPDVHLCIDRLDIDAGAFSIENLESDLAAAIATSIGLAMRKVANTHRRERSENTSDPFSDHVHEKSVTIQRQDILLARDEHRNLQHDGIGGGSNREQIELGEATIVGASVDELRSRGQVLIEVFHTFLDTGRLPWSFQLSANVSLEQVVADFLKMEPLWWPKLADRVRVPIAKSAVVQQRFIWQFSESFRIELLKWLSEEDWAELRSVLSASRQVGLSPESRIILENSLWRVAVKPRDAKRDESQVTLLEVAFSELPVNIPNHIRIEIQEHLVQVRPEWEYIHKAPSTNTLDSFPGAIPNEANIDLDIRIDRANVVEATDNDRTIVGFPIARSRSADSDGIYVRNAGVVLLCPFIPMYFKGLAIADDARMHKQDRAIALLHYLATGETDAPEYELTMFKILCGLGLEIPVTRIGEITNQEKEESSALLTAVIRHWSALGNTSIDGLRESFLQRSGIVNRKENGDWIVQMEVRSFDVLLDRLPWGIARFHFPWMPTMCKVEWNF